MDNSQSPWHDTYSHYLQPPTFLNWLSPLDGSHLTPMPPASPVGVRKQPMPSYIQVAKPYIFQQTIDQCLRETGVSQAREDNIRLAGVQWIDNVRRALKLPVRTFDTAVVYYHKFRLVHADGEYSYVDAAGAALFTACKIEDTLKKSRDILCAAYNLKLPPSEHLSPDDQLFEHHSRSIIGLERLMLEASSFDFRNRHPQQFLVKLAKHHGYERDSAVIKTAWGISIDLYRTFAPLKQTTATMAFAALELAGRLHNERNTKIESREEYSKFKITRGMVMETLLDLLELYTHYRTSTTVGPDFPVDLFLNTRIPLNAENLPRFTEYHESPHTDLEHAAQQQGRPDLHARHSSNQLNGRANEHSPSTSTPRLNGRDKVSPGSGSAPTSVPNGTPGAAAAPRPRIGERGRDGTVRFMLNPDQERQEKEIVSQYVDGDDENDK